ncbi:outer membrane beta-barrel protein [Candidatus Hepatobacter penaei]|uniref:outer membrane beta-barrel protein n=1 Tax=Candidatus Hepatobacter penaei TaxID=1274402 RepID=UPI0004F306AD|nr:outer membrane beta-barrel protein [Candidatus Hepatobacter penaei]
MKKIVCALILGGAFTGALAETPSGMYGSLNVGGIYMNGTQRFMFDYPGADDFFLYGSNKGKGGFALDAVFGSRFKSDAFLSGVEGFIGYTPCEQTLSGALGPPANMTEEAKSKVKRDLEFGIVGLVGFDMQDVNLSLKLGLGGAQFTHRYSDEDTAEMKKSKISPSFITGLMLEMPVAKDLSVRFDYTLSFHKTVETRLQEPDNPGLDHVQTFVAPKVHAFTAGVSWYF